MADEKILLEIEVDYQDAAKDVDKLTNAIEGSKNATKNLEQEQKRLQNSNKQNSTQYKENAQLIALNKQELSQLNVQRRRAINVVQSQAGSLTQLRAKLAEVTEQRNRDLAVGSKAFNQANKDIAGLNKQIKAAEEGGGDFRRSVGNYGNALTQVNPAIGGAVSQFMALKTAAMAFIATPIGLVLAAVAAAVGAVITYFKRTEEGGDKLAVAMAYVTGAFESALDIISNLGEFFATYFVNAIKITINNFKLLGKTAQTVFLSIDVAIQKITGTQEEYNKSLESLRNNNKEIVKLGKEQVKLGKEIVAEGAKQIEQTKEDIKKTFEKSEANANLQISENNLRRTKREALKTNAELQEQIFKGLKTAKDENLSYEEREKGLKKATRAEQQLANKKVEIATEEARIARERAALYDSDADELDKVAQAEAKVTEARTASLRVQTKIQATLITFQNQREADRNKEANQIKKQNDDALKREQNLADQRQELYNKQEQNRIDELGNTQAGFEAQNALFDTQYEVEKERIEREVTDEEEKKIKLEDLAYDTEQKKYLFKIEFAEKQKTVDEELADNQKKLDEEALARKKQIANDSIGLLNDVFNFAKVLGKKDEKLQQDLGIAQAVINTAVGVTKAFSQLGPIAGIPAAAGIAVKGATQIAAIKAASNGGGGGGTGDISGGALSQQAPDTTQIDQQIAQQEALQAAISNLGLTVSVTEINEVQNAVQVSEQTSQI
jgi:hypothetical protein